MELTLNVFTLNCWGIPGVSKNRKERMEAIAKYLSESNHNIVCLQEIWSEYDYLYLKDNIRVNLPYSHYFYSGVLGSGLCVFSKWVIEDVFFHQWPLNGYIHKIHHGDWFGGKGVGLCRIKCNDKLINVYCTHLHADYNEDDIYLAHRVLQAYLTAEFVNMTKHPAAVAVLAGDLNTGPGELSYRLISELPGLIDPYNLEYENDSSIKEASGTCDNANNSYSNVKLVEKFPEGKRIDHILFHANSSWQATVSSFGNPLTDRVPGQKFSYSDHNAVALTLTLEPAQSEHTPNKTESLIQVFDEAIKVCNDAMITIRRSRKMYLFLGVFLFTFLIGTVGYWPSYLFADFIKILLTGLCFYCIVMGSLWNLIEMNSLKAGLSGLENSRKSRYVEK